MGKREKKISRGRQRPEICLLGMTGKTVHLYHIYIYVLHTHTRLEAPRRKTSRSADDYREYISSKRTFRSLFTAKLFCNLMPLPRAFPRARVRHSPAPRPVRFACGALVDERAVNDVCVARVYTLVDSNVPLFPLRTSVEK